MPKTFITGRPGVGKSYITEGLKTRDLAAYDLEEVRGIIRLEVKETNEPIDWPEGFVDWNYYAWRMQAEPLANFVNSVDTGYFSASANNQAHFYTLFDTIIVLTLDDPLTLRHRLENRNAHENGQTPENIDRAVERFLMKQSELLSLGGIAVSNDRPVDTVLDEIIEIANAG